MLGGDRQRQVLRTRFGNFGHIVRFAAGLERSGAIRPVWPMLGAGWRSAGPRARDASVNQMGATNRRSGVGITFMRETAQAVRLCTDANDMASMRHRFGIVAALVALATVLVAAAPTPASAASNRPAMPRHAWLQSATTNLAIVRWTPVRGATSYDVRIAGRRVGSVRGTSARLTGLRAATFSNVQVVARRGRLASVPTDPIPAITKASTACTHYVSSSGGSDAGAGTAADPWRTIGKLVGVWQAGWVGCVSGSFVEDVSIFRGGTSTAPVTLRSRPGTRASIRGRVWVARGADFVVVSNLRLDGRAINDTARDSLPSPTVNARGTMLLDNDISNAGTRVCMVLGSIRGYGAALAPTVAYNRIHDCGRRGANTHHGIYMESTRYARIAWNAIFDNADRGIQLYPDAQRSLIVGNVIDGNGTGIIFSGAEGFASSRNLVLRNVIANSESRNNLEHYWELPGRVGAGNIAARNCLGGARQGNVAVPVRGYAARANYRGVLRFRARAAGDLRPLRNSGCRAWMLSRALPLAPFG